MDMEEYLPFIVFGLWTAFVVAMIAINGRSLRRAVMERIAIYGNQHEWREASPLKFPRLKLDFYDDCQAALEQNGFKILGDIEDATLAETRNNPNTFRRVMLAPDKKTVAEFWQINYPPWKQLFHMLGKGLGDACFIRIFSEAEDGRIFSVMRAPKKMRGPEPGQFNIMYMDGKPAADEVWAKFSGEFPEYLHAYPDFTPRSFNFIDTVIDSETRQQTARIYLRKSIGLITRDELVLQGMPDKSIDSYLRAFSRQLEKIGGWPKGPSQ